MFEVACLAGEDGGIAEGVREERGSLDAGEERYSEVAGVRSTEQAELALGPVDDAGHHGGCLTIVATLGFVEFGTQRPHWAAVPRDRLTHVGPAPGECLEAGLRRAVPFERLDQCRGLRLVAVEDGSDQLVPALEVVVDVAEWDLGVFCDFGERRAVDALFVEQFSCAPARRGVPRLLS